MPPSQSSPENDRVTRIPIAAYALVTVIVTAVLVIQPFVHDALVQLLAVVISASGVFAAVLLLLFHLQEIEDAGRAR